MIYILFSIFLYSLNNVQWKKNLEETDVFFLVSYRSFFTSILSISAYFLFFNEVNIDLKTFFKISLGSVIGTIGLISMLKVIKHASLKWLFIYNLLGILFTSIYLFIYEDLELKNLKTGIIIIMAGYAYFIFNNRKSELKLSLKNHLLLLLMTLSFCISSVIHWGNLMGEIHPVLIAANQECFVFLFSTIGFILFKKEEVNIKVYRTYFKNIIIMSVVILFAVIFSFLGVKETNPIVSSLLFLASPILTILMSSFYFKEKIAKSNKIAILLIAIGAFILKYHY